MTATDADLPLPQLPMVTLLSIPAAARQGRTDKALSWALPAAVLFAFLAGLLAYAVRRTRRNRAMAAAAPVVQVTALSERDRLVLEDELDLLDA